MLTAAIQLMYFSCNVSFSSLPVFLPTILKEMGFTAVNAQGLSAPPYFVSFLVTIGSTFLADRIQQRGLTVMIVSIVGGVGYIRLATCKSVGPKYFGVFLAAGGVFPATDGPRYVKGQSICAAFMFFNAFLALSLRLLLTWENKKLDEKYGKVSRDKSPTKTEIEQDAAHAGEENYGENPSTD